MIRTVEQTKSNQRKVLINLVGLYSSIHVDGIGHQLTTNGRVFHLFDQFGQPQTEPSEKTEYVLLVHEGCLIPLGGPVFDLATGRLHYNMTRVRSDCEQKAVVEIRNLAKYLKVPERVGELTISLTDAERKLDKEDSIINLYNRAA